MTSTITQLQAEDRKATQNAERDYRAAVTLEANGGTPDITSLRAAMATLGKTAVDFATDLAADSHRKELQAIRQTGLNAASQIGPLSLLIEQADVEEKQRRAEFDADQAERRAQLVALQADKVEGEDAGRELFDGGSDELKADYRDIKSNEQQAGRAVQTAESELKAIANDLHQAEIRVFNVKLGTGTGDIDELRAAVKSLEAKRDAAQRKVDSANAAMEVAKANTQRARQAVIES